MVKIFWHIIIVLKFKKFQNYLSKGAKVKSSIRIIVTRSEKDLSLIKDKYSNLYSEKIIDVVEKKFNGHLKDFFKKILGD